MIIGSTVIKYHYPEFREPKDLDIIYYCDKDKKDKLEWLKIHHQTKKVELLKNPILIDHYMDTLGYLPEMCYLNDLLTLKMSHAMFDLDNGSFDRHLWDINFLQEKGHTFNRELFYKLFDYWQIIHGKRKVSKLNMSAEEFFDNAIDFPIPHDNLHELLITHPYFKGQEKPTYTKILKDDAEVDVDEIKFNKLSEEEKFNLVFEEVAVMATERYSDLLYKAAYTIMLKKFILNHAPEWEAFWIILNHKKLLTNIPFNFLTFLKTKI